MSTTNNLNYKIYDLAFIGSGIATSFTLLPLLEQLQTTKDKTYNIAVIEKNQEFHTGIAYGKRTGDTALLITSLDDFLPKGKYRNEFIDWLNTNKEPLIASLSSHGGELTKNWLNTHKKELINNQWENLYIPRRFFGIYIHQKVETTIASCPNVNLDLINNEVLSIKQINKSYQIDCNDESSNIVSNRVVLSIGIPPIKKLWSFSEYNLFSKFAFLVENPYDPDLNTNLKTIKSFVSELNKPVNVLIIGSNASAMEMIYKLNDEPEICNRLGKFIVVSPQGELPNSAQNEFTKSVNFQPKQLQALHSKASLTAIDIYNAANLDLDEAECLGYGPAVTEVPLSKEFNSLLNKLSKNELVKFACFYGNEIGKRQRRAGQHYTQVVEQLLLKNKLINLKGYFKSFYIDDNGNGLTFNYLSKDLNTPLKSQNTVQLVISCIGGKLLSQQPLSPLIDQLIKDKYCLINQSERGFKVNTNLEASKNIYVAGPLLAGNVINGKALWHLEHCGRIIALGDTLGLKLSKVL